MFTVKRILILYALFIFCILFSFVFFSIRQVKLNEKNIDITNQGNLSSINTQFTYGMDSVRIATINAGMQSDIRRYQFYKEMNKNDVSKLLNQKVSIRENLKNVVIANRYIASIDVLWFSGDTITTRTDLDGLDVLIKDIQENSLSSWNYMNNKDIYYISYFPNSRQSDPEYVLSTKVRKENIYRILENAEKEFKMNTFIYFDEENIISLNTVPNEIMSQVQKVANKNENELSFICFENKVSYRVYMKKSQVIGGWLISYVNYETIQNSNRTVIKRFIGFITFLMGIAVAIFLMFYLKVLKNLDILITNLKRVENGDYTGIIASGNDKEFTYVFEQFNAMTNQTNELIHRLTNERNLRTKAEFRHLQAQIEPHFFYNNLSFIMAMAKKNPDAVEAMATQLAEYYRYKTTRSLVDTVTLGDEIALSQHYLAIMSFRKKIEFTIVFSEIYAKLNFLPLIIQPLVENSIYHGIESRKEAKKVDLMVREIADGIEISISDDGQELSELALKEIESKSLSRDSHTGESVGLWNVQQRLMNQYGQESRLKFEKNGRYGLKVHFWISFKNLR